MSDKIYLVRVSYLVPVVAASEIDAVQFVMEDQESCAQDELQQLLDGLNDPDEADPAHLATGSVQVEREVTVDDLEDPELEVWLTAAPWGDDEFLAIEERLLGTEEVEEEE